jgi:hypothetical protein
VPKWVAGQPERSFWQTTKTKGRLTLPVATLRCTRCGFLHSYALPDAAPG